MTTRCIGTREASILRANIIIIFIMLAIIKLIISSYQPLNGRYTMKYDDLLMVRQADSIIHSNWLGDFSSFTLIKGIATPLFIAMAYQLNIPFLLAKELLYCLACMTLILVIRKKIDNPSALITIFIILLFNPVEFSTNLSKVYRDEIYISLLLFLVSFACGIFLNRKEKIIKQVPYFIGLGLSFTAIYLCREESVVLMPFMVFITLAYTLSVIITREAKRLWLYMIPITIFLVSTNLVCYINYKHYGEYTLNQFWSKPYKEAYGALTRVIPKTEIPQVPVTSETIEKLLKYSPKFAELGAYFHGKDADVWRHYEKKVDGEFYGAYFYWILMQAVEQTGYYTDAKTANEYYRQLAREINNICDSGVINARKKMVNNYGYFDLQDLIQIIKYMPEVIKYQISFQDVNMKFSNWKIGNKDEDTRSKLMMQITNQSIEDEKVYYSNINNKNMLDVMNFIKNTYAKINPIMFIIGIISLIAFFILTIKQIKNHYEEYVILISLMLLYSARIFVIAFVSKLIFSEALCVEYLSSIYNIQYLIVFFALFFTIKEVKERFKKGHISNGKIRNRNNYTNSSIE